MGFKVKIDKADTLVSKWVKLRDNYTCQRCGRQFQEDQAQGLDCSHFKTRAHENTRYDPLNLDAICTGCHSLFHREPEVHRAWQISKKGQEIVERLDLASHTYKKKDRVSEALYWKQELDNKTYLLHR